MYRPAVVSTLILTSENGDVILKTDVPRSPTRAKPKSDPSFGYQVRPNRHGCPCHTYRRRPPVIPAHLERNSVGEDVCNRNLGQSRPYHVGPQTGYTVERTTCRRRLRRDKPSKLDSKGGPLSPDPTQGLPGWVGLPKNPSRSEDHQEFPSSRWRQSIKPISTLRKTNRVINSLENR